MENTNTPEKKECSSCKGKLKKSDWILITVSFYVLFSSIYGTIQLIKNLF